MPRKEYYVRMTWKDILDLFDSGKYVANLEKGKIYSGRTNLEVFTYQGSNRSENYWLRLYKQPKHITIARSRLIWIIGNRSAIPKKWEVHHWNTDSTDDSFDNLFALHPNDHRKLHEFLNNQSEEVPF